MALALVLRNSSRINGAAFAKTAGWAPLKTYTTLVTSRATSKQLALKKNVLPLSKSITLSAPKMAAAGGNHAALWTIERAVSLGLLAVIPAAFLAPSQALDSLLAVSVVLHQHWGIEAAVMDYVRPVIFGNVLPKVAHGGVYLLSIATLGGLFYFIYNDVGIVNAIKKLWAVEGPKKNSYPPPDGADHKKILR